MTEIKLAPNIVSGQAAGGKLAANILAFTRLLRDAGLPLGTDRVAAATEAVMATGVGDARVFYWTLHASLISHPHQRDIFNQAFHLIWRDPGYLQQLMSVMAPNLKPAQAKPRDPVARRLADSLFVPKGKSPVRERDIFEFDARGTASDAASIAKKDFEQMTAAELRAARRMIDNMPNTLERIRTRRFERERRDGLKRFDLRATMAKASRSGFDGLVPVYKSKAERLPPLVALCDISGSMDTYSRLFLHFLYAIANGKTRSHVFLFGTELTNATRILRGRDPDAAVAKLSSTINGWAGGTRIGQSLESFNRVWARRVLGQNATVLLLTDGLDRAGAEGIGAAARRLRSSARCVIWLNPLLRYERYAPLAAGAVELSKHVSEMRPCHSVSSLADLAGVLSEKRQRDVKGHLYKKL